MSGKLLESLLRVSLSTSLVIAALLLLAPLLQRRYAARWRHAAWLLVALRLLVPATITLPAPPIQIHVPQAMASEPVSSESTPGAETLPVFLPVDFSDVDASAPDLTFTPIPQEPAGITTGGAPSRPFLSPMTILALVWAAGAIGFLLLHAAACLAFRNRCKRCGIAQAPPFLQDIWRKTAAELNVKYPPALGVSAVTDTPVLTGLLRPCLLLPHGSYQPGEATFILRHELVHHKRRDLWTKLVLFAANTIHWFNPLVWLMTDRAGKDIELSCDDAVTRGMDPEARSAYGSTILATLPRKRRLEPVFTTHFGSSKTTVKQRLKNLFDFGVKRRGAAALCAVGVMTAALGGMLGFTTASAAGNDRQSPPATTVLETANDLAVSSGGTLNISLDRVTAGQIVKVGKILVGSGDLVYNVSADAGQGLFVSLSAYGDMDAAGSGHTWRYYSGRDDSVKKVWQDVEPGEYYVYVGSSSRSALTGVAGTVTWQEPADTYLFRLEEVFAEFAGLGLSYSGETGILTWNGERVQLFVIDNGDNGFELCWRDREIDSGLALEGLRDENRRAVAVQPLAEATAKELLEELADSKKLVAQGNVTQVDQEPISFVYNADFLLPNEGLAATDKDLTTDMAGDVARWIEHCDKESGVYLLTRRVERGYETWLYYNDGNRYPWNVEKTEKGISLNIITSRMKNPGSTLVRIDSGEDRLDNLAVLVDGAAQSYKRYASAETVREEDYAVNRLGSYTLSAGDTVKGNATWSGGTVLLLFTQQSLTDQEIGDLIWEGHLPVTNLGTGPMAGLMDGNITMNYAFTDKSGVQQRYYFTTNNRGDITWQTRVTDAGSYNFYVITYGDVTGLAGGIQTGGDLPIARLG